MDVTVGCNRFTIVRFDYDAVRQRGGFNRPAVASRRQFRIDSAVVDRDTYFGLLRAGLRGDQ